jgi:phage-related protein
MTSGHSEWKVVFYTRVRGDSPPREYIMSLGEERAKIARSIKLLSEVGTKITMPQARHLKGPLWELRPVPHRLIYFALKGRCFVILHAFRKTTNRTPRREIEIAEKRMNDFLARMEERGYL